MQERAVHGFRLRDEVTYTNQDGSYSATIVRLRDDGGIDVDYVFKGKKYGENIPLIDVAESLKKGQCSTNN